MLANRHVLVAIGVAVAVILGDVEKQVDKQVCTVFAFDPVHRHVTTPISRSGRDDRFSDVRILCPGPMNMPKGLDDRRNREREGNGLASRQCRAAVDAGQKTGSLAITPPNARRIAQRIQAVAPVTYEHDPPVGLRLFYVSANVSPRRILS